MKKSKYFPMKIEIEELKPGLPRNERKLILPTPKKLTSNQEMNFNS